VSPTADRAILIDSSVLIAAERRQLDLAGITAGRANPCFVSVITASELLHGVHRANDPARRAARAAYVEGILGVIPLLDIDLAAARAHAELWASLERAGTLIGPYDLWIAASALASGSAIATTNIREFNRVPGLAVESWSLS
jgi:tRNA(fMet)-specific endonuclease VapC